MTDERPLNSDQLGHKGQTRFGEICNDVGLTANPSTARDRSGWDFIVEFPMKSQDTSSIDQRPAPLSCHFQVKTIWSENTKIKLRLSMAELLAKELKPTFIYVFRINKDLSYSTSYLIHLFDEALATILKRLRSEHAKGTQKINSKFIALPIKELGKDINSTGTSLLQAVTNACGNDLANYTDKKKKLLNEIGYNRPRFHGEVSLRYGNNEALIDAFLGKGKIEVIDFEAFETRFDISLPKTGKGPNKGLLTIDPKPKDKCKVIFRSGGDEPATFNCDVYSTPAAFSNSIGWKILIHHDKFDITISKINGTRSSRFDTLPDNSHSEAKPLSEMMNIARLWRTLARGNCTVIITPTTLPSTSLSIEEKVSTENEALADRQLALLSSTKRIFSTIGDHDPTLSLPDIIENRSSIFDFAAMLDGKAEGLSIGILPFEDKLPELQKMEKFETLIINFIIISGRAIGYSLLADLKLTEGENGYELRAEKYNIRDIIEFKSISDEFETFVEIQKSKTKVPGLVVTRPVIEGNKAPELNAAI
jgi:hypothetical protein